MAGGRAAVNKSAAALKRAQKAADKAVNTPVLALVDYSEGGQNMALAAVQY